MLWPTDLDVEVLEFRTDGGLLPSFVILSIHLKSNNVLHIIHLYLGSFIPQYQCTDETKIASVIEFMTETLT